jgi:predicted 3-demethylubiquinone-9 3-methyltransferase (glyoxalase superfamily)
MPSPPSTTPPSGPSPPSQKITPFLWFDKNLGLEAAEFYVSLFPNSSIVRTTPIVVTFNLCGQEFCALNGGPEYKFTPAISLYINCEDQKEVDHFWDAFSKDGGAENRCGWVSDKYGVSWQVVPKALPELMGDKDKEKAGRVMEAMLKMGKLSVEGLERAYRGE